MAALPRFEGLDSDEIRRLLTKAWLTAVDARDLGAIGSEPLGAEDLRHLATALEVHAILSPDVAEESLRACAFVAAEALDIARDVQSATRPEADDLVSVVERLETGLLYLIAGYDANAAVVTRSLTLPNEIAGGENYALASVLSLISLDSPPEDPPVDRSPDDPLDERVRDGLWRSIAHSVGNYLDWLRSPTVVNNQPAQTLRDLADRLADAGGDSRSANHPDIHHIALLVASAIDATTPRALRGIAAPANDGGRFEAFVERRCRQQPLLWPAAADYARLTLPGPTHHAVVSVPTGAGKSGVADLAIAQSLHAGWVLVLAPTNALTGQLRRQLRRDFAHIEGVVVREFLGGVEYTSLEAEALGEVSDREILVMTPEKCSLALRQAPEAFERLALCVVDEAHQLGQRDDRAVVAELVLSEILLRAPHAPTVLLSALVANPDDLASWLRSATNREALVVREPWRPTRTLRAIAGFDIARSEEAGEAAVNRFADMPANRVNSPFQAPIALLAGLQGTWVSTENIDYSLVRTGASFPANIRRNKQTGEMTFDPGRYVRPAVQALAQELGDRGQRVMAFLPRSRHYSFAAARDIEGFGNRQLPDDVEAFLRLSDAELGIESELRAALQKGVGVHTSALLTEERRASELAFDANLCPVLFATGTLAQGLNLPATVVLIGGTEIGFDQESTPDEKEERVRAQLLNAIGRAGRAWVSARSMAIVVPDKALGLRADTVVRDVLPRASFLAEEDASTEVASQLVGLVEAALLGNLAMDGMSPAEQTAFTVLAGRADDTAVGTLRNTWAAHRAGATDRADEVAETLRELGATFLASAESPEWVALAAHRSGTTLAAAAAAERQLAKFLVAGKPETTFDWADALLAILAEMPVRVLRTVVRARWFKSTSAEAAFSDAPGERPGGWIGMNTALRSWLQGDDILSIAATLHEIDVTGHGGRSAVDPLPRTLRAVQTGFAFDMASAAGLLAAIVDTGSEQTSDEIWELQETATQSLARLPLAVRLGAADPGAMALLRVGARPRAVAHLIAEISPPGPELGDEDLLDWATTQLAHLDDLTENDAVDEVGRTLLGSLGATRAEA